MFIGELINQHRKDHGLTMEEFAERAGISKGYVSMLEKNENPKTKEPIIPSLPTIRKIAIAMQTDVAEPNSPPCFLNH